VVTRWTACDTHRGELMGMAPSIKRIEMSGMSMDRISGGKMAENWVNWDTLEMLQQIDAIPESEQTQGI
jgi:predicted ester cyclase